MPANNRFSDNPFRDPNLTPEQVERIEKRNEALRIYRETGDEGPAIEIGLFPGPEKVDASHRFIITITSRTESLLKITSLMNLKGSQTATTPS